MSSRTVLIALCLLVVAPPSIVKEMRGAVLAHPSMADTETTGGGAVTIRSVSVQKESDSLAIELQSDGTCAFKQYEFTNPHRIVVDLYGAVNRVKRATVPVDHLAVRAVRVGQYKLKDPTITRIVLDLEEQAWPSGAFQVKSDGGRLRITLNNAKRANAALDSRLAGNARKSGAKQRETAPLEELVLPTTKIAEAHAVAAEPSNGSITTDEVSKTAPFAALSADSTAGGDDNSAAVPEPAVLSAAPVTAQSERLVGTSGDAFQSTTVSSTDVNSANGVWTRGGTTQILTSGGTHLSSTPAIKDSGAEPTLNPPENTQTAVVTGAPAGAALEVPAKEAGVRSVDLTTSGVASPLELKRIIPMTTTPLSMIPELREPSQAGEPADKTAAAITSKELPVIATGTEVTVSPLMTKTARVASPSGPAIRTEPAAAPIPVNRALVLKPLTSATTSARAENGGSQQNDKAPAPEMTRYSGEPISLDFKDGDLVDFFRLLSQITGLNIILDPAIRGNISIKMTNVPYDQVFDVVLENNDLEKKIHGNVVRVARKDTLRKEEEERRRLKEAQILAADTVTEPIKLNYANAEMLAKTMSKHLSPKGEIVVDARTNTLIVKDIPEPMLSIKKLIYAVDTAQPQVEIEARIVSASRDFARDIGVQLGFVEGNLERSTVGGPNTFNTIGGVRPSASPSDQTWVSTNRRSGRGPAVTGDGGGQVRSGGVGTGVGNATDGNYIVNLPANLRYSGLGYSLGNIFDKFLLDTSITAGESRGVAKLISQPKVTVQNNTKANITQGLRFPVQVIQNNTVTVQFFDAALKLEVVPQITEAGTVLLELSVQNNVADFSRQVNSVPSIRTSESKTRVLVSDGGTTVIAGILVDNENRTEQRAPGIANLPIVGNLFKRRFSDRSTQEVLFFITPRIRKEGF